MACLTAFILASTLLFSSIGSLAQGLTQVTDGTKIAKGTISADDQAILKAMFDLNYYRSNNPDLANLNDSELFKHFCEYGIFEGRTCNAYFDPSAYASAYPALKAQFGNDIMAYFRHYATIGKNDPNFSITTLEACANTKITVTSLIDPSIVITPELYYIAKRYNIDSYSTVKAIQQAIKTSQPTEAQGNGDGSVNEGDDVVIVPAGGNEEAFARAYGLNELPIQIPGEGGITLKIYVSYKFVGDDELRLGAAVKDQNDNTIMSTQDYEDIPEYGESAQAGVIIIDKLTNSVAQEPEGPKFYTTCFSFETGQVDGNIACTSDTVYEINTDPYYADSNGEEDTEYSFTGNISVEGEAENAVITGSIGIYSEETGFGYVADYTTPFWIAE